MRVTLFILCFIEILLISFAANFAGPYLSPILFLASSLSVAFIYLRIKGQNTSLPESAPPTRNNRIIAWVLFLAATAGMYYQVHKINITYPVSINDTSASDILPLIMHLVHRFTNGIYPYTPVPFAGYAIFPNYLPFTWMPYCVAEWMHKDYRWVPAAAFWLAALYTFIKVWRNQHYPSVIEKILVSVWPLIIWHMVTAEEPSLPAHTVEGLIAAYYLLLAMSLHNKTIWLAGIAIALCLFSRYGIVLWLPVFAAVLWLARKRMQLAIAIIIVLLIGIGFYWIPFLHKDPSIFQKGFDYYHASMLGEWNAARGNNFWHMGNGLGFTRYIFALFPDKGAEELMDIYSRFHLTLLAITIAGLILFYYRRKANIAYRDYLLFSFKIYLTVFYIFIPMPYKYLYLVPVAVSAALLTDIGRRKPKNLQPEMP